MIRFWILGAACAGAISFTSAQQPTAAPAQTPAKTPEKPAMLSVGDKAPALAIEKWIKGAPVASFEKGKVYMLEFWATWCPPCIRSMPHITELQKVHGPKGLTVIGMTSHDDRGNTLERVEQMVTEKGDEMGYTVAWDKGRQTSSAFMEASGQGGIPCSFLVDRDGFIAYIGHPMEIDPTLELVMAGKHDIKALAAAAKVKQELELKGQELNQRLSAAIQKKDWKAALELADQMLVLDPVKFSGVLQFKFNVLANELKDLDKAYAMLREFADGVGKDDAQGLGAMAWMIVDPSSTIGRRDLDLAMKMAERAVELTKRTQVQYLDVLARVHFTKGDIKKAIELQTEAVALDKRAGESLKEYQEALAKKNG